MSEWSQTFHIKPIPYGATERTERRTIFKNEVQAAMQNDFIFLDEIQLEITIFLDQQDTLETDRNADLDNYAKMIIDCLKGSSGIMIDDTQVQSLQISWIDTGREPYFSVYARALMPDTDSSKKFSLYEMSDGLWYPIRHDLATEVRDERFNFFMGLVITSHDISCRREIRQKARRKRMDRLEAYRMSGMMTSSLRGFHKSRVLDCGFLLVEGEQWKSDLAEWKRQISETEIETLDLIARLEDMYTMRAAVLDAMPG